MKLYSLFIKRLEKAHPLWLLSFGMTLFIFGLLPYWFMAFNDLGLINIVYWGSVGLIIVGELLYFILSLNLCAGFLKIKGGMHAAVLTTFCSFGVALVVGTIFEEVWSWIGIFVGLAIIKKFYAIGILKAITLWILSIILVLSFMAISLGISLYIGEKMGLTFLSH